MFPVLEKLFPVAALMEVFPDNEGEEVILYGEGIGPKIQKVGKLYRPNGPDFVLFDVKVAGWWLERKDVLDVAQKLDLYMAPGVESGGTLAEAEAFVTAGFESEISETPGTPAEGLILRPHVQLFARDGSRIITKIKTKDFQR